MDNTAELESRPNANRTNVVDFQRNATSRGELNGGALAQFASSEAPQTSRGELPTRTVSTILFAAMFIAIAAAGVLLAPSRTPHKSPRKRGFQATYVTGNYTQSRVPEKSLPEKAAGL